MKLFKILSVILCFILCFSVFTGCGSSDDYLLYFELDSVPSTLDPQLVKGTSEEMLVRNIFEGLMKKDKDGNTVLGAAKDYSVSDDGLSYTFHLKDDAVWSDETPVKAEDFLFAFKRAVNPKNKAPYVSALYSIVGAKDIATGKKTEGLGVFANDKTLTINLVSPNPNFLNTLTLAICMPCRKDVYNKSKGQYGITSDTIVSNGPYKIRFWEKGEKFSIRINRNSLYKDISSASPSAVIFSLGTKSERGIKIENGNLDMGFVDIDASRENTNIHTFEKSSYCLFINKNSPFGSMGFRKAFAHSIHRNRLKNELDISFKESLLMLPDTVKIKGAPLSNEVTVPAFPEYDPNKAHNYFINAAQNTNNLPKSVEILYFGDKEVEDLAFLLAEQLQQSLGAVVNTKKTDSESSLKTCLSNGEYQLAIAPVEATGNDPLQFFECFTKKSNNNIYGFSNSNYDAQVAKMTPNANLKTITDASNQALEILSQDLSIIPLALHLESFGYGKDFSLPAISLFDGVIDFSLVTKV